MRIRYRLMLLSAALLAMSVVAVWLWPAPSVKAPVAPLVAQVQAPAVATPARPRPRAVVPSPPVAVAAVPVNTVVYEPGSGAMGTVVPPGPGDVAPEPESLASVPQENDPIVPEQPQTREWRLEKTARASELLGRDVERLEHERDLAEAQGNGERAEQIATLIRRHRSRLHDLQEEMHKLGDGFRGEPIGE